MLPCTTFRYCHIFLKNLGQRRVTGSLCEKLEHKVLIAAAAFSSYGNNCLEAKITPDTCNNYRVTHLVDKKSQDCLAEQIFSCKWKSFIASGQPSFCKATHTFIGSSIRTGSLRLFSHNTNSDSESPANFRNKKKPSESGVNNRPPADSKQVLEYTTQVTTEEGKKPQIYEEQKTHGEEEECLSNLSSVSRHEKCVTVTELSENLHEEKCATVTEPSANLHEEKCVTVTEPSENLHEKVTHRESAVENIEFTQENLLTVLGGATLEHPSVGSLQSSTWCLPEACQHQSGVSSQITTMADKQTPTPSTETLAAAQQIAGGSRHSLIKDTRAQRQDSTENEPSTSGRPVTNVQPPPRRDASATQAKPNSSRQKTSEVPSSGGRLPSAQLNDPRQQAPTRPRRQSLENDPQQQQPPSGPRRQSQENDYPQTARGLPPPGPPHPPAGPPHPPGPSQPPGGAPHPPGGASQPPGGLSQPPGGASQPPGGAPQPSGKARQSSGQKQSRSKPQPPSGLRYVKYPPNVTTGQAVTENDIKLMNEARLIFDEAVISVLPHYLMRRKLDVMSTSAGYSLKVDGISYNIRKNLYVVGFGKAVLGMARAVEDVFGNDIVQGLVSVPMGIQATFKANGRHDMLLKANSRIAVIEGAADNIPDASSYRAALEIKRIVEQAKQTDVLIVLISGGGSALLPCPKPPINLDDLITLTKLMGKYGATINQMNAVRKQLEVMKAGGLAKLAQPAKVISFILSDIIGDHVDFIAGGPTVQDTSSPEDALRILSGLHLLGSVPPSVMKVLHERPNGESSNMNWSLVQNTLIGSNTRACNAACARSLGMDYVPILLSTRLEGEAREVGRAYINLAYYIYLSLQGSIYKGTKSELETTLTKTFKISLEKLHGIAANAEKVMAAGKKGLCIVSGGETTVVVKGSGLGGRNQEMALAAGIELDIQFPNISLGTRRNSRITSYKVVFLAAGTDGKDGPTSAAGGVVSIGFIADATSSGIDVYGGLERNDSFKLLSKIDGGINHVITGITGTNVMDIHVLLITFT